MKACKRIIILLFLFVGFGASAQKFGAGFFGGFSATQVDGDDYSGYNKFGFIGGAFTNYLLQSNKKIEMQILFMQKGSKVTPNPEKGAYTDYFLNINYLDFPILYVYEWKKFIFKVGPMVDIYLGRKEESNGTDITDNPNYDFRPVGISFYGNVSYRLGEHFALSAIYTYSLINMRKQALPDSKYFLFEHGQYSNAISFGLNYSF